MGVYIVQWYTWQNKIIRASSRWHPTIELTESSHILSFTSQQEPAGLVAVMKWTFKPTNSIVILLIGSLAIKGQQNDTCIPFPNDPSCGCTFGNGTTIQWSEERGESKWSTCVSNDYAYYSVAFDLAFDIRKFIQEWMWEDECNAHPYCWRVLVDLRPRSQTHDLITVWMYFTSDPSAHIPSWQ